MPSRGCKFITEFLLPSLNEKRFGSRLMWLDIENQVFQMQWIHKSASDWSIEDAVVFAAWDKKKGHYKPHEKEYLTKSKQRFRAALNKFIKNKYITELSSGNKYSKIYCIGNGQNISGTYVTVVKSEEENDGNKNAYSIKVKQNPDDLVLDWNSILENVLFTEPEGNLVANINHVGNKEPFIEEQVVTDFSTQPEDEYNYNQFLNISSGREKKFTRETLNVKKENDRKSLHIEFHFPVPKANVSEEDNLLRTIENYNFHDYISTGMDTLRQTESPDLKFDITPFESGHMLEAC